MNNPARRAWIEQRLSKWFEENYGVHITSDQYIVDLTDAMRFADAHPLMNVQMDKFQPSVTHPVLPPDAPPDTPQVRDEEKP